MTYLLIKGKLFTLFKSKFPDQSVVYFYSKHLWQHQQHGSNSRTLVVVVVVVQWCLSKTGSQISFSSWAESAAFGPQSQVRSDTHRLQPELHYNTETLSSAADNGISVIQSHVLHLSKIIRPPTNVGWDPLAYTQESANTSCPKNTPLKNLLGHKNMWGKKNQVDSGRPI